MNLLLMHLGVSSISAIFNLYTNHKYHKENFNESKRRLKFRELSSVSKGNLKEVRDRNLYDDRYVTLMSFIPIYNFIYTSNYLLSDKDELDDMYKRTYDDIIDTTNFLECEVRILYLKHLKEIRDSITIPQEYIEKIKENELGITEKDYKKILKLNNMPFDENVFFSNEKSDE